MSRILAFIFVMVFISGFSAAGVSQNKFQENQRDSIVLSRLSVGFGITPSYLFQPNQLFIRVHTGYDLTGGALPMTYQVDADIKLTKRFSLLGSVAYAQKDVWGVYYCHVCDLYIPGPEKIKLRFIEVPVVLRMQLVDGRFGTHIQTGLVAGFLLNEVRTDFGGIQFVDQRANLQAQIGLGINYKFTPRLKGLLTANYNHTIVGRGTFGFRSVGLNLGLLYQLK